VEITEARLPVAAEEIVDFMVTRTPKQDRALLRSDLDQGTARTLRALVTRDPDGALQAWVLPGPLPAFLRVRSSSG
jgi:hypothetical protein